MRPNAPDPKFGRSQKAGTQTRDPRRPESTQTNTHPRRLQEARIKPRRSQKARIQPRSAQETRIQPRTPRRPESSPGAPRRPESSPGASRRPESSPGVPRRPPGGPGVPQTLEILERKVFRKSKIREFPGSGRSKMLRTREICMYDFIKVSVARVWRVSGCPNIGNSRVFDS